VIAKLAQEIPQVGAVGRSPFRLHPGYGSRVEAETTDMCAMLPVRRPVVLGPRAWQASSNHDQAMTVSEFQDRVEIGGMTRVRERGERLASVGDSFSNAGIAIQRWDERRQNRRAPRYSTQFAVAQGQRRRDASSPRLNPRQRPRLQCAGGTESDGMLGSQASRQKASSNSLNLGPVVASRSAAHRSRTEDLFFDDLPPVRE